MRSLVLLLLLNGCNAAPDFTSRCGVGVYGDAGGFQDAEDRYLGAFGFDGGCDAVAGWNVRVREDAVNGSFTNPFGVRWPDGGYQQWAGFTECDGVPAPTMWVARTPRWDALAHERTHANERCADPGPEHSRWVDSGIYDRIAAANR